MVDLADIRKKSRRKKSEKSKETPVSKKAAKAAPVKKVKKVSKKPPATLQEEVESYVEEIVTVTPLPVEEEIVVKAQQPELETIPSPLDEIEPITTHEEDHTSQMFADSEIPMADSSEYCLSFNIRKENCAIPIDDILEIIPLLKLTPVPNAPDYVMGIISLRGTVIPVIDLGIIMGHDAAELTDENRVVVLREGEEHLGFLVDRVSRTLSIDMEELETPPISQEKAGFIKGLCKHEEHIIMVIDGEKLI